ncbi:protein rep [Ligilactobacillus ruminis]|uniref:protein rep n=1 Tax=Ligilactobacillus ruminis TaxID=1623 RepID=UPI001F4E783E|nr:protein rep [Ligilactobacillus ruminis]
MLQNKKEFSEKLEKETEIVEYRPGEKMTDRTKSGKIRPWRQKKTENVKYSEYLEILKFKKAYNVRTCAETLNFAVDQNGEKKLYQVWFCKSRLCPMCSWRRALKTSAELEKVLSAAVTEYPNSQFLFLTLTIRNVTGDKLKWTLKRLTDAFHKMMKYKKIKYVQGYVRSTEVTVNESDGSYHPHLHVLLMVTPKYFSNGYITQDEWTELWKKALKIDYRPVVNIKKIHDKKGKGSLKSAALETAKYQTKSKNYLNDDVDDHVNLERLKILEDALKGTRQFGYGGVLKEIVNKLKLPDEDDLVHVDGETDEGNQKKVKIIMATFDYTKMDYFYRK